MPVKGMHQSFLLDCPFDEIILKDFYLSKNINIKNVLDYRENFNLFDTEKYIRKISIKEFLSNLRDISDLKYFIKMFKEYDYLVLIDDNSSQENRIFEDYYVAQKKALIWYLKENGIKPFIVSP